MSHKLEADGILLSFGARKILSDIYIRCETGSITAILGRNGSGKSSLMNVIYGSLPALNKSVRMNGTSILQAFKRPDLLTYLPQFNFIPSFLSVKQVFADFSLKYDDFEALFPAFQSVYRSPMGKLSGGQRRLLEVYIIIKAPSTFSMLDEPFSHVTPIQVEVLKALIQKEKQTKGFLITDHLYHQVTDISDRLYVLKDGTAHLAKSTADLERFGYING